MKGGVTFINPASCTISEEKIKSIEIIREAKKASKCPPGFKYSKKKKSCVAVRKKGKYIGVRGYLGGGYRGGDNRSGNGGNGKNGNGNGNGNY